MMWCAESLLVESISQNTSWRFPSLFHSVSWNFISHGRAWSSCSWDTAWVDNASLCNHMIAWHFAEEMPARLQGVTRLIIHESDAGSSNTKCSTLLSRLEEMKILCPRQSSRSTCCTKAHVFSQADTCSGVVSKNPFFVLHFWRRCALDSIP